MKNKHTGESENGRRWQRRRRAIPSSTLFEFSFICFSSSSAKTPFWRECHQNLQGDFHFNFFLSLRRTSGARNRHDSQVVVVVISQRHIEPLFFVTFHRTSSDVRKVFLVRFFVVKLVWPLHRRDVNVNKRVKEVALLSRATNKTFPFRHDSSDRFKMRKFPYQCSWHFISQIEWISGMDGWLMIFYSARKFVWSLAINHQFQLFFPPFLNVPTTDKVSNRRHAVSHAKMSMWREKYLHL